MFCVLRFARPLRCNADASRKACFSVDHKQLSVCPVVKVRQGVPPWFMELPDLDARSFHLLQKGTLDFCATQLSRKVTILIYGIGLIQINGIKYQ